jgi:phage tail sheath protein FI
MATFNKPGVYIQEVLSPNLPVATATGVSTAAFIGVTDRGPVTGTNGSSVIGAPTLVTDFADFCSKFVFGAAVNAFDSSVTSSSANPNSVGTSAGDLKYALYSFFQNGGTQAYVTRVINKTADVAKANFVDNVGGTVTVTTSSNTLTTAVATNSITVSSASGTPFATAEIGRVVSFTGVVPTTGTQAANVQTLLASTNSFVITAASNTSLTLAYTGTAYASVTQTTGTVTAIGASKAASAGLTIASDDPGTWGNNIWVAIVPNSSPNYFDINVYYSTRSNLTGSTALASDLQETEVVERIPYLSLNSADARYAPNIVNSPWINVIDNTPSASSATRVPYFTSVWNTSSTTITSGTGGSFQWNSNNIVSSVKAIRVGSTATTTATLAGTLGTSGSTAADIVTEILPKFDAVPGQLIFNYPNKADATNVNALLDYAGKRGDSFVIVDPGSAPSALQIPTDAVTALSNYTSSYTNYGASYYPNIAILDPASTIVGKTINIAPGGAVAAIYSTTDNNRGTFKSPAGVYSLINNAVPVYALSSSDFDAVSGAYRNLNIIRQIPGSGTCVMGARTISSAYSDKYIAVRRALNYIGYSLRANTQFAIFEPNDQNLWAQVSAVVSGFLNDFWAAGGLAGATADQAYYVKCDSTINTPAVISAGELRIEVGVALQRPAEFVVIKIGQINGGSTVTTSI